MAIKKGLKNIIENATEKLSKTRRKRDKNGEIQKKKKKSRNKKSHKKAT